MKRVYKPNLVLLPKQGGDHSSRPCVAAWLKQPTRKCRRISPALSGQLNNISLFGLAPQRVYLAALVTKHAGELLPHRFTHHPEYKETWLVYSLLHLSSLRSHTGPGRYPVRCPMVFGLSSLCFRKQRSPDAFHYQGIASITNVVKHANNLLQKT